MNNVEGHHHFGLLVGPHPPVLATTGGETCRQARQRPSIKAILPFKG